MKWSEQMRVLNSEDEHYNQLMYDADTNTLYINDKSIACLQDYSLKPDIRIKALLYDDFKEIIKKYPFFTDIKFLLNCIFKTNVVDGITYDKSKRVIYQKFVNDTWLIIIEESPVQETIKMIGIQINIKENTVSPV